MHVKWRRIFEGVILFLPFLLTAIVVFQGEWFFFDHAAYRVVGESFWSGHVLYKDTWDHHPPLMYILVGLLAKLGAKSQLCFLGITALLYTGLYYLYLQLLSELKVTYSRLVAVSVFSFLATISIFAFWNTEQYYAPLLALLGLWFLRIWKRDIKQLQTLRTVVIVGGVGAILLFFKIQAWVELIGLYAITLALSDGIITFKKVKVFLLSALISILPLCIFMASYGLGWTHNLVSIILYNFNYITIADKSSAGTDSIVTVLKILVLVIVIVGIWWKSLSTKHELKTGLWVLSWFTLSLFAATLSGRIYPHYFVQFIVPFSLLLVSIWYNYRIKLLQKPKFLAAAFIGLLLVLLALFSQVNTLTLVEGKRFSHALPIVISNMFLKDIPFKDRLACLGFDSSYYCSNAVYELPKLIPPGSRIAVIADDPAIYIDTYTTPSLPYFSDVHAAVKMLKPWTEYLSSSDYLVVDSVSLRAKTAVEYGKLHGTLIFDNMVISVYRLMP